MSTSAGLPVAPIRLRCSLLAGTVTYSSYVPAATEMTYGVEELSGTAFTAAWTELYCAPEWATVRVTVAAGLAAARAGRAGQVRVSAAAPSSAAAVLASLIASFRWEVRAGGRFGS